MRFRLRSYPKIEQDHALPNTKLLEYYHYIYVIRFHCLIFFIEFCLALRHTDWQSDILPPSQFM